MSFTKEQIQEYILVNMKGANFEEDSQFSTSLKLKLVEAKVLVDRWNLVSTDIIIHSSLKDLFRTTLGVIDKPTAMNLNLLFKIHSKIRDMDVDSLEQVLSKPTVDLDCDYIWGVTIHYSDDIPKDKGLMIALNGDKFQDMQYPDRCIAVFPM